MRQRLQNLYLYNSSFRGLVQAVEGGAVLGFLTATTNGFDFSKKGIETMLAAVVGGSFMAFRNYLINRPGSPAGPIQPVNPAQEKQ